MTRRRPILGLRPIIRQEAKERGMSDYRFARLAEREGVACWQTVYKYLRGEIDTASETAYGLAQLLSLTVMKDDEEP